MKIGGVLLTLSSISAFLSNVEGLHCTSGSRRLFYSGKGSASNSRSSSPSSWTFTSYSQSRITSRDLSMHLGHSHSHHHHHDHNEDNHDHNDFHRHDFSKNRPRDGPASGWGKVVLLPRNDPQTRVFLCAIFFLIPIAIRRSLTRIDVAVFAALSVALSLYQDAKRSLKNSLRKLSEFQQSLLKHTTPLTKAYFFKNENSADRVTLLGVWTNIFLSVIKLAGGITFNSAVLVADAGHSLSDLLSDFITLWAVQIARLPPDEDHPYGHGKFESVGSLFLSLTLLATGVGVGSWSYDRMSQILLSSSNNVKFLNLPTWPALALALTSIFAKEWLFRVTKRVGDLLNSQVIIANAWHHRSDAFSSILSLASIAMAMYLPGLLVADSAAGILIAGMICMTGLEILIESVRQLTDTSDTSLTTNIESKVRRIKGVEGVTAVRSRSIGSGSLVDMTLLVGPQISSSAANAISEKVRWSVIEEIPSVMDVLVRTVTDTSKVCPLLVNVETRSVGEIEDQVRAVIKKESDSINEVKKVIVHFVDNALVTIEAVISFDNDSIALKDAYAIAGRIRDELTRNAANGIHDADVYIDTSTSCLPAASPTDKVSIRESHAGNRRYYGIGNHRKFKINASQGMRLVAT